MKRLAGFFVISVFVLSMTGARTAGAAEPLKPISLKYSAGSISQDGDDLYFAAVHPGFALGNLAAVFDISFIADKEFRLRDQGNDAIVLGDLTYHTGEKFHLHYGDLENLTLGSGFVVQNYRSNIRGNTPLNRQKGMEADITNYRSSIKVFATKTHLVGVRAVRNMGDVTIGTTAAVDSDPDFEEFAVDALVTLEPDKLSVYAELAKITDYGDGFALGVLTSPVDFADIKMEFRDYDSDFAPGIVDEHYEAAPVVDRMKANTMGRLWGFFSSVDLFHGHKSWGTLTYEDYEETKPRFTLYAEGSFSKRIKGDVFYATQNFVPNAGAASEEDVMRGRLSFMVNRKITLTLDYYQAYSDDRTPLNSLTVGADYKLW